ncbi:30S ribosomal protein S27ae [Candidatus Woesearchaeota archaeon CG_4_10_14_0_2_um_filter_33_13]|nr:MAG: 30S ribosomal protein S27ae [Candidatus Woesearchaeota archaeon CG_4_10_14_0_2_um_filter_33_13]
MAAKKGGQKKGPDKSKGPKVKKAGKKQGDLYEISGSTIKSKNLTCPKCGQGILMGKHKDRNVCGKCGYVEYVKKA